MSFPRFALFLFLLTFLQPLSRADEAMLPLADLEEITVPTPAVARLEQVKKETYRLRGTQDMAGLEKLAVELRASRESLDGGTWLLTHFYNCAVEVPDKDAEPAMEFYRRWATEHPESITAQICLAEALKSYAWNARGSGWADSVTEEGWRLMKERLAEAWDVLQRAQKLAEKCPAWYSAAQGVALGQGWERDRYMQMVDEAIAKEPTYGNYYTRTCYWLLPRWYGEEGDFEKWIAEKANTYPEDKRDWQYARFVWMADLIGKKSEMVFEPGRLDWDRTKKGFEDWLATMPDNLAVRSEFTRLAVLADDPDTAREQFELTGPKFCEPYWGSAETFEKARLFAYEDGENPFIEQQSEPRTSPTLPPKAVWYIKLFINILGGFIGGVLAGTCLVIIAWRRQQVWPGVIAFIACVLLAIPFGTILTLLPGVALWLYLRHKAPPIETEAPSTSGWIVLLWLILLVAVYLGLQFGAVILLAIPIGAEHAGLALPSIEEMIMSDRRVYIIFLNAAWITLLTLLAICPPQSRKGWEALLGLVPLPPLRVIGWTLVGALLLIVPSWLSHLFMDERSREAMDILALGLSAPIPLFLAVVVFAPIIEELIFRGYVFSSWVTRMGFWSTALCSSVLFAVMHFQYGPVALAYVFVLGLILAALRWKTGSIYPSIALHILNNAFALLGIYWEHQ